MGADTTPPAPESPAAPPRRRRWILVAGAAAVALVVVAATLSAPRWWPSPSGSGALSVELLAEPTTGYAPLNVKFTAQVAGGTTPYSFSWSGAAVTGVQSNPVVLTFSIPGNRTITVTVTDAAGTRVTATYLLVVVSPYPQASTLVPPATTVQNVELTIMWHASASISSCVLPSWGTVDVPAFAACGSAGGISSSGPSGVVGFQPDPDDPEYTPVLFQSSTAGVPIGVSWWYNETSGVASSGSVSLVTAVAPL